MSIQDKLVNMNAQFLKKLLTVEMVMTFGKCAMLEMIHRAHELEEPAKVALLTLTSPSNGESSHGGF